MTITLHGPGVSAVLMHACAILKQACAVLMHAQLDTTNFHTQVVGNCSITPIHLGLDDAKDPDHKKQHWVRMLNASEFFDLTGAKFDYQGREHVGEGMI